MNPYKVKEAIDKLETPSGKVNLSSTNTYQHVRVLLDFAKDCLEECRGDRRLTFIGPPVAWQIFNPLTKSWTNLHNNKAKVDSLIEQGFTFRPVYAEEVNKNGN